MTPTKLYPRTALVLLTALNLLNYIDRSVLFAVQQMVHRISSQRCGFGYLTSVFFIFYMFAAPFMGRWRTATLEKRDHCRRYFLECG